MSADRCPPLRTVVLVLGMAAAYYITGKLGLLLAIPPGYATAIWPPAGLSLAAALLYGYRVWPGVMLGSMLVNAATSWETTSLAAQLASAILLSSIGMGAALQAVVGAYLVRRYVGFPSALNRERDIGAFLLLGGPVSCLVNATVGVTTLVLGQKIPLALSPLSWWTWWAGDAIGVLIVTPLVLSWRAEPRQSWRRRRLTLTTVLASTLTLAIVFFVHTSFGERERLRLNFERQAEMLAHTLQNRLADSLEVLYAIQSFFVSSTDVTRQEFHTFVQGAFARHPDLRALSVSIYLPGAQRPAYEEAMRLEGYDNFQLTERDAHGQMVPAAARPYHVVVSYVEPYASNEKALGFDAASDPNRLEVLDRLRDTGHIGATGRLILAQERGDQFGWLAHLPIYRGRLEHATVEERRQHLRGYATAVFRLRDMVETALRGLDRQGIVLRIEDGMAAADQRLLYDSQGQDSAGPGGSARSPANLAGMHWHTTMALAGRRWVLHCTPTLDYLAARQSLQPWSVLAGGLLFSGLLGSFVLVLTGRAAIIEQMVVERTAELSQANTFLARESTERRRAEEARARLAAIVESSDDAIISYTLDGTIVSWNAGAETMFGYAATDVQGRSIDMLRPSDRPNNMPRTLTRIRRGERVAHHDVVRQRQDGTQIDVSLALSPVYAADGQITGGASIYRDITARKRAEEVLRDLVEGAPDAMVIMNPQGEIVLVNEQTEQLFGYRRVELLGRPIEMLMPERFRDGHVRHRAGYFASPGRRHLMGRGLELFGQRKNGQEFSVEISLSTLQTYDGLLVSSAIRDITERKQAEEALQRTAAELARSNADLAQFAYAASHDLQEPLRGVAGCVQLLARDYDAQLDARGHEFIVHAVAGVTRMQMLIQGLLAYSRVNTHEQPMAPVDCTQLLQDVLANLAASIQESQARITCEPLPTLVADPTQLLQVFQNLLGNAIKFRRAEPLTIHIAATRQDGAWLFSVRDNGIGIAPQHAERIFVIFQRLHTRSRYPGTGIGLALCKKIVERHGGRIWIESEPGQGTTFSFTIPDGK